VKGSLHRLGLAESPLTRRFAPTSPRKRGEVHRTRASADSTQSHHALDVSFQEVVHPVLNEEAEVVEALANPRRTEWTPIRMRL
jgi:hypothetical protein